MSDLHINATRRRFVKGVASLLLLSVSPIGLAGDTQLVAVRIWPSSSYTRITLESTMPLQYNRFILDDPERLVIDISGISLNQILSEAEQQVRSDDPFLKRIRVGQYDKNTIRVVFELKKKINPEIFSLNPVAKFHNRLVIDLYPYDMTLTAEDDPILALLRERNDDSLNLVDESSKKPDSPATSPSTKVNQNRTWVIMIDPGHGGEDPGAIGKKGTKEKEVVLSIAHRLRKLLLKEKNIKVHMTRTDDAFIPLDIRVAKARKVQADLLISIHADAFTNRAAKGSSVFALSKKGATSSAASYLAKTQNKSDQIGGVPKRGDRYLDHTLLDLVQSTTMKDSLLLGREMIKKLKKVNTLHKKTVEQAGFIVLQAPEVPSVLVETAFISNEAEEKKLKTAYFQQKLAENMLAAIKAFISNETIKNRRNIK